MKLNLTDNYTGKGILTLLFISVVLAQYGFCQAPSLSSPSHSSVEEYTAVLGGNIASGSGITEAGIVWSSSNSTPTTSDTKVVASGLTSTGTFSIFVMDLPAGSTVYYRAYATNGSGTGYSTASSFSTNTGLSISFTNGASATEVVGQPDLTTVSSGITSQKMNSCREAVIDYKNGKLYVADRSNHRVLRFAYPITASNPTAELVFGQPDFTSNTANNGGIGANTFNFPGSLAVDNMGRLWVGDFTNQRVLWFNAAYSISSNQPSANGVLGQSGFTGNSSGTTQSTVSGPAGLAIDSKGNLYVIEQSNSRVLRFDKAALKSNGANADAVLGQSGFTSNTLATSASGMRNPLQAVAAGTTLWVSDNGNSRILRFDNAASKSNGANADGVLGQADFVSGSANRGGSTAQNTLSGNVGLAVDFSGGLWVADLSNQRVLRFDNAASKSNGANADGVLGQSSYTTNATSASASGFSNPRTVTYDWVNNKVLVAQTGYHRISQFGVTTTLLPVKLLSFGGTALTDYNLLQWQTSEEINTSHFEVQRSIDGYTYESLDYLPAKGLWGGFYSYSDYKLPETTPMYYRLKMQDYDGTYSYSRIISISRENTDHIILYPNPVSTVLYLHGIKTSQYFTTAELLRTDGCVVKQILLGNDQTEVDMTGLEPGLYLLRFADGRLAKLLKQ